MNNTWSRVMDEWTILYEDEPNKIHLLQVELEAAGIPARIPSEEVAVTLPFLQPTIAIMVKSSDLEQAKTLLNDFLKKWRHAEEDGEKKT